MLWPLVLILVAAVSAGCSIFAVALQENHPREQHERAVESARTDAELSPLLRRRKEMAWEMV